MLDSVGDRDAQWHFLKGAVCWRKGWLDEARRHYEAAAAMEPGNPEYRRAVEQMENGPRYRPGGKPSGTLLAENLCFGLIAAAGFCECCGTCGTWALCGGTCWGCSQCAGGMPR